MPQTNLSQAEREQLIANDKILAVHGNMPTILYSSLFGAWPVAIIALASNSLPLSTIIYWLILGHSLIFTRWFIYREFKKRGGPSQDWTGYKRFLSVFSLLSGLFWAVGAFIFIDVNHMGVYCYLILTIAAMIGGCMTAVSSIPRLFDLFSIPATFAAAIASVYEGGTFGYFAGAGLLIHLGFMARFSRSMHSLIHNSLALKYENNELVASLKEEANSAAKANRDKSYFLATASHDLRQPLHAINLFVEALKSSATTKEQDFLLDRVTIGLDSMGELFDALLDISRMDANTIPISKRHFNVGELIQKLSGQFRQEIQGEAIELKYDGQEHWLYTDPVLLERILRNLLNNAVRYTNKGHICISTEQIENKKLRICVTDTGVGIPEDKQASVFEEFTQLHNPERDRNKGLGLGLAIVNRLVKLLAIELAMTSQVGKGTQFSIDIPLGEAIQQDASAPFNRDGKLLQAHLKTLIIDNEVSILESMSILLQQWGFDVYTAQSSEKALDLIKNGLKVDLVISDFRMPGPYNGAQLIEALLNIKPDLIRFIISGDTSLQISEESQRIGAILLSKPIKPDQLYLALTQALDTQIKIPETI